MTTLEKIKCIIWHEYGHLCVDSILVNRIQFEKFQIAELKFYRRPCLDDNCWGGHVQILPDPGYEMAVQHADYLTLKLITLTAGCAFQTIYTNNVLKNNSGELEKCFGKKESCKGNGDYFNYNELLRYLIDKVDKQSGKKLRGNIEELRFMYGYIPENIIECFISNKQFFTALEKHINTLAERILLHYKDQGNPERYDLQIDDNELAEIITELSDIITKNNFDKNILKIYNLYSERLMPYFS